mmetsp:Transcript_14848/g.13054  ORF Transcript_14848/g.13054 Transcript_14848/m.13054 type:complete len:96 (+) Transcript_14848:223-510(+)
MSDSTSKSNKNRHGKTCQISKNLYKTQEHPDYNNVLADMYKTKRSRKTTIIKEGMSLNSKRAGEVIKIEQMLDNYSHGKDYISFSNYKEASQLLQ